MQTNQHDKLDLYSDSSQKQQHEGRLVALHITLIPSQTSLCSHALSCVLRGEAANTKDTNGVYIKSHKSKERQYNGKKDKRTNNDL